MAGEAQTAALAVANPYAAALGEATKAGLQSSSSSSGEQVATNYIDVSPTAVNLGEILRAMTEGSKQNGGMGIDVANGFSLSRRSQPSTVPARSDTQQLSEIVPFAIAGVIGLVVIMYMRKS